MSDYISDYDYAYLDRDDAKNIYEREINRLQAQLKEAEGKYQELIMQVANKFPDETRHETALRYIKQAEESDNKCAKQ